jgi:hypothetical protein
MKLRPLMRIITLTGKTAAALHFEYKKQNRWNFVFEISINITNFVTGSISEMDTHIIICQNNNSIRNLKRQFKFIKVAYARMINLFSYLSISSLAAGFRSFISSVPHLARNADETGRRIIVRYFVRFVKERIHARRASLAGYARVN